VFLSRILAVRRSLLSAFLRALTPPALQHTGDAGETSKRLEAEGARTMAEQQASIGTKKEAVISCLVALVTKV